MSDKRLVYVAFRVRKELHRDGEPTISDAVRGGVAGWALNEEHCMALSRLGVSFIGVWCGDDKEFYLCPAHRYFDPLVYKKLIHPAKMDEKGRMRRPEPPQRKVYLPFFTCRASTTAK